MIKIIGFLIRLLTLFGFTACLWTILGDYILFMFKERYKYRKLLRSVNKAPKIKPQSKIINFLNMSLKVVLKNDVKYGAQLLILCSLLLFIISFLLLFKTVNLSAAFLIAFSIAASPYVVLLVRLRTIRIDGSYEGETLVIELTNYYKENYYNMREAIDLLSNSSSLGAFSKTNLFRLSIALKSFRTEEELDKAIQSFVFAYNTEWAIMLGMNIKIAVFNGINVSVSLDDIVNELKLVREMTETEKRFNSESISMIRYLFIPLYLYSVFATIKYIGFSFEKFIEYQFFTPLGLKSFILTMLSITFSFILLIIIKKPKFDL